MNRKWCALFFMVGLVVFFSILWEIGDNKETKKNCGRIKNWVYYSCNDCDWLTGVEYTRCFWDLDINQNK